MSIYKTGSANIICSDYPDPDIIRVDDAYYMVSTTMYFFPGCVILRSYNLLDWEFCSYVFDQLEDTPGQKLEDNRGVYGRGMWAACLRHHNNKFYVSFVANDTQKTYLYTADSITGPWTKSNIQGFYHDMSILFDDDGRVFVTHGNMNIHLIELKEDLSGPKENGIDKIIIQDIPEKVCLGYEGSHFYKINNKYYIFLIHIPNGKYRTQACFVSDKIEGPYIGQDVLCADYKNWNSGIAQGGIVQTPDHKWYGILFQDHGALGRMPVLVPVVFDENNFPVFGETTASPEEVTVLDNRPDYKYAPLYSNDFLNPAWQWNHYPNKQLVSVSSEKLCITTNKLVKNITQCANTYTQRVFTEHCEGSVFLNASNMKNGDFAGLCALESEYAFIGLTKENNQFYLVKATHTSKHSPWTMNVYDDEEPGIVEKRQVSSSSINLKIAFNLEKDVQQATLFYANDNSPFNQLGTPVPLRFTLDHFTGVRFGLFYYSTKESGGQIEFSVFKITIC